MKIAILEDDPSIQASVMRLLEQAGHECIAFDRGHALIRATHGEHIDLFVLDWCLPDLSGVDVVKWIRNHLGVAVPVLLLTSRSSEEDVVEGLTAGADDFVSKPFQPAVLIARVAALGRRLLGSQPDAAFEHYGGYAFDLGLKQVQHAGRDIQLTTKEFQLALFLFRSVDRAVSRQHVLETIWGVRAEIPTRTLDSHVTRLRSKLTLRPENGYILTSVHGFGYRLEEVGRNS